MPRVSNRMSHQPRTWTGILSLMTIVISIWCGLPQAFAAKDFRVGIVDPQVVIEKSKSGKRALATLQEHATVRQKLLASDEKEIETLQEELQNGKRISEKEKQAKQELLQRKLQEYQKRRQEFQVELNQKHHDMIMAYMSKIEKVIKVVADRHQFSLVIDKGRDVLKTVLYSRKGLDITNEVIKEVNKRFP